VVPSPYRIAAPPEPERFDQIDAYEAALRSRTGLVLRAAVAVGCAVALFGVLSPLARQRRTPTFPSGDGERAALQLAEARVKIANAKAHASADQARFAATILTAVDHGLGPGAGQQACRVRLPQPYGLVPRGRGFPMLVTAQGDRDLPSASLAPTLALLRAADEAGGRDGALETLRIARALRSIVRFRYETVLLTSVLKRPVRTTSSSFVPGAIAGRAYLYDSSEGRVICAGDVAVESSRQIAYSFMPGLNAPARMDQGPSLSASLDVDLDAQLQGALAGGALFTVDD
jgi:hypothetical protein